MPPLLQDKIVFVSGGSQGLGAAVARAAVRERARAVVVTGRRREAYEILVTDQEVWDRALDVQRQLAGRSMTRSVGIPDLLVAAVAELHRVTVLHYDTDFDHVASITRQPAEWVVPRGGAA